MRQKVYSKGKEMHNKMSGQWFLKKMMKVEGNRRRRTSFNMRWVSEILRNRCLSLSAMLHVWTLKSQQTRPCSWWWTVTRAGSHRLAGPDLRAVLAAPGSTLSRRMLMLSHFHLYAWTTEIFRGHGAAQRSVRTTRWWWWWVSMMQRSNFGGSQVEQ